MRIDSFKCLSYRRPPLVKERLLGASRGEFVYCRQREFLAEGGFELPVRELIDGRRREVPPLAAHGAQLVLEKFAAGSFVEILEVCPNLGAAVFVIPILER